MPIKRQTTRAQITLIYLLNYCIRIVINNYNNMYELGDVMHCESSYGKKCGQFGRNLYIMF